MNADIREGTTVPSGFFTAKGFGLTVLILLIIGVVSGMSPYAKWQHHLSEYMNAWESQREDCSVATRMTNYYGEAYVMSSQIKTAMKEMKVKKELILFPPNGYCEVAKVPFKFPEPAVFYYYTGLHAIWMNSPLVKKATHLIKMNNGSLEVVPVKSPADIDNYCKYYKQFEAKS